MSVFVKSYEVPAKSARQVRRARCELGASTTEILGMVYSLILTDLERARVPLEIGSLALEMVADDIAQERAESSLSWADENGFPRRHEVFKESGNV